MGGQDMVPVMIRVFTVLDLKPHEGLILIGTYFKRQDFQLNPFDRENGAGRRNIWLSRKPHGQPIV